MMSALNSAQKKQKQQYGYYGARHSRNSVCPLSIIYHHEPATLLILTYRLHTVE